MPKTKPNQTYWYLTLGDNNLVDDYAQTNEPIFLFENGQTAANYIEDWRNQSVYQSLQKAFNHQRMPKEAYADAFDETLEEIVPTDYYHIASIDDNEINQILAERPDVDVHFVRTDIDFTPKAYLNYLETMTQNSYTVYLY